MKKTKEVTKQSTETTSISCDMCENETDRWGNWTEHEPDRMKSLRDDYPWVFTASIDCNAWLTHSCPWGEIDSKRLKYDLDVCPKCFMDKILPLTKGVKADYEE